MVINDLPTWMLVFCLITFGLVAVTGILAVIMMSLYPAAVVLGALLIGLGGFISFEMVMLLRGRPVPGGGGG